MTDTDRPLTTPLVVSVLPAHRRLALLDSRTTTMQPSARDSSRQASTV